MSAELLPSGNVTFVFTDIEGSTRLFRQIGDRYPLILDRHRDILRDAWVAHRGREVKTEGDAFFVAFADPSDAVAACVRGQRDLAAEPWPNDAVVRVRMGVHTGLASPRDGDYIAYAVHQTARVVSAGHGGQVLVSAETAALLSGVGDVVLRSLGRYRVRDFDDPLELFQAGGLGLAESFAPLRVLPADRHNLHVQLAQFVGRDGELDELAARVDAARLVTVVGPGGLGKTRLVVEHGLRYAEQWEHGVWFVGLSSVTDPTEIPQAIANAVAAPIGDSVEMWTAVVDHLRDRRALLVLDNCEHVNEEAGRRIAALLAACPGVSVLATSRQPLGLRAERIWRPGPLDTATSAVELFCQRAGINEPTSETRAAVADLCGRLDGLPLAIELAAARADVLSPTEIAVRLDAHRERLASCDPTLEPRQRSLDDLIDWSYQLLNPAEQAALRRLGVFAAGFDLDAAVAAIDPGAAAGDDVVDLVWSLMSKSLLAADTTEGATRYRMLDTVRSFARRLLDRSDEHRDATLGASRFYLKLCGPIVRSGGRELASVRQREIDNLRGLVPAVARHDAEVAQELAATVVRRQGLTSPLAAFAEGRAFLEQLPDRTTARVLLLLDVANVVLDSGDFAAGNLLIDQAKSIEGSGSGAGVYVELLDGRSEQLRGTAAVFEGDAASARSIAQEALERVSTLRGRGRLENLLFIAEHALGHYEQATTAAQRAVDICAELGDPFDLAVAQNNLADLAARAGDVINAARLQLESMEFALEYGSEMLMASACILAAQFAAASRSWSDTVRLLSATSRAMTRIGYSLYPGEQEEFNTLIATALSELGPTQHEAEARAGAGMAIEDVIAMARRVLTNAADGAPIGPGTIRDDFTSM